MESQPQNFEAQPQNLEAQPQNIETQQGTSKPSLRIHLLPFPAEERGAPKAPQGSAKRCRRRRCEALPDAEADAEAQPQNLEP